MQESQNLNFLRSWAVLLVVVGHLFCFFSNPVFMKIFEPCLIASYGVALFFVHTFLVLMLSLERQEREFGLRRLFTAFMIRRIFRIYPLSLLVVACTILIGLPLLSFEAGHFASNTVSLTSALANLTLTQNFFKNSEIVGPLWSLPYEIQMYFFLPPIYLFSRFRKPVITWIGIWIFWCLVSTFFIAKNLKLNQNSDFVVFPLFIKWIPCFIAGIISYYLHKEKPAQVIPFWVLPLFLLISSLMYPMSYAIEKNYYLTLMAALLLPVLHEVKSPFLVRPSKEIAKYSYGIYLFHFPAMWLSFDYFSTHSIYLQSFIFLLSLITLCTVAFHFIEKPLIDYGKVIAEKIAKG